jgi:hypothetical protein
MEKKKIFNLMFKGDDFVLHCAAKSISAEMSIHMNDYILKVLRKDLRKRIDKLNKCTNF